MALNLTRKALRRDLCGAVTETKLQRPVHCLESEHSLSLDYAEVWTNLVQFGPTGITSVNGRTFMIQK
jgi:hypothetical protein